MKKLILSIISVLFFLMAVLLSGKLHAQSPVLKWAKNMGGTSVDQGRSITTDAAGNVYTVGDFKGTADFDPDTSMFNLTSAGYIDCFISKLDASGNFVWAKSIAGITQQSGVGVGTDSLGNVYVMGYYNGTADFDPGPASDSMTSHGSFDIFIVKLDSAGNFIWAKDAGGAHEEDPYGFTTDAAGNSYVTGSFSTGAADFDPGPGTFILTAVGQLDVFILKLDAAGNFTWAKQIGGSLNDDEGHAITVDASGNVFTTGWFSGATDFDPGAGTFILNAAGQNDIFISKLDSAGNFVWADQMGGTDFEGGFGIGTDAAGNVYSTGTFYGTADFDPRATTYNLSPIPGYPALFISKLSANGNFLWAKGISGISDKQAIALVVDAAGNVFTTGYFGATTTDFDPGPGIFNLNCAGAEDIYISELDSAGNFVLVKRIGGTAYDFTYAMAIDGSSNLYLTGGFEATTDFDPGAGVTSLTSKGQTDDFTIKMGPAVTTSVPAEKANASAISIYPNPTNGLFDLVFSKPADHASIQIYNSIGALVYSKQTTASTINTIELTDQADGIYFIKVMSENKMIASGKIVKQ